jgi:hypothetical protein
MSQPDRHRFNPDNSEQCTPLAPATSQMKMPYTRPGNARKGQSTSQGACQAAFQPASDFCITLRMPPEYEVRQALRYWVCFSVSSYSRPLACNNTMPRKVAVSDCSISTTVWSNFVIREFLLSPHALLAAFAPLQCHVDIRPPSILP